MQEGLLALFRDTTKERPPSFPAYSNADKEPDSPVAPSAFLRQFLLGRSPQPVSTGLPLLDSLLDGGFSPGLHLAKGATRQATAALLDSVAWESVSRKRPVLYYYAHQEAGIRLWMRLMRMFACLLGEPSPSFDTSESGLSPEDLMILARLDGGLQVSVFPYLSPIAVPEKDEGFRGLTGDVRERVADEHERHGRIPVVLVEVPGDLRLLAQSRPGGSGLSRLNRALRAISAPGLVSTSHKDGLKDISAGPDVQTVLKLTLTSNCPGEDLINALVEVDKGVCPAETLALVLDRRSGLLTGHCSS